MSRGKGTCKLLFFNGVYIVSKRKKFCQCAGFLLENFLKRSSILAVLYRSVLYAYGDVSFVFMVTWETWKESE